MNLYLPVYIQRRLFSLGIMSYNDTCATNCSGHGECDKGICVCEVQFNGDTCMEPNTPYFVAFATIFYAIALVSFIQLILCIRSEFIKMKNSSLLKAFRITTQKAIYLVVCLASILRGVYFSYQGKETPNWANSLLSAYYPILLTGSSLIVCFWAEVFHLSDLRLDKQRFLGKSFIGFIGFNVVSYSLLLTEFLLTWLMDEAKVNKNQLTNMFYGCYAVLLFIVVIFFLFYGVEVYFKIRGGFTHGTPRNTDNAQLHQSRFGLIFQATMLLITIGFLFSEMFGQLWKNKVAVLGRNYHDVLFRVVELGVALWFPCVLWNCISPEQLWILNPQKIFKRLDLERTQQPSVQETEALVEDANRCHIQPQQLCAPIHAECQREASTTEDKLTDCWICYDAERQDAGALIQPCSCKGDMGAVHHECLKKWLVESATTPDNLRCKVCKQQYLLERGHAFFPSGFTLGSWLYTFAFVTCMCGSAVATWTIIQLYEEPGIRMLTVGICVLVFYVCLKFLGFSAVKAYQRSKVSAVKILGRRFSQTAIKHSTTDHSSTQGLVKVNVITSGLPTLDETPL